jgi:hypothetical protein
MASAGSSNRKHINSSNAFTKGQSNQRMCHSIVVIVSYHSTYGRIKSAQLRHHEQYDQWLLLAAAAATEGTATAATPSLSPRGSNKYSWIACATPSTSLLPTTASATLLAQPFQAFLLQHCTSQSQQ